jgi:hypothetical protein
MDYIPTRRKAGNHVYLLAAVLAHNLNREMQMLCHEQERNTTEKRAPLWCFEQLGTLRRKLIQRAGRLTKPQGTLTLTMSANQAGKQWQRLYGGGGFQGKSRLFNLYSTTYAIGSLASFWFIERVAQIV